MIDNVKNWSYPFAGASGNPLANLTSLAKATSGFYPMGANGLWHGGVHFDQGTAGTFDQSSVRCIADGEVIAYRIDDTYPISEYIDGLPQCRRAPFSSGFVLVKHQLTLPPLNSAPSVPAPPALTFYSLYMHLQDWAGYLAKPDLPRPSFWGEGIYQVKANTTDPVLGLNVRGHHRVPLEHAQYSAYRTILCTLPRGTHVEVDEVSPDGNWLKLSSVNPLPAELAASTGWVFKNEMKFLGGNSYLIAEQAKDVPATPQQGLNIRASANSTSDILAVLPHGTQVKISSEAAASKYHKLLEVVRGDRVPALIAKEDGELPGFVWRDSLESKSEPKVKGSVVVLESPVPIKAGDLIGHLGLYQNHNEGSPQAILHLEVFSCEDVPAFIAQSRAHAARLPETQKTLLKVHKGASKLIPHHTGINAANPPKLSDDGVTVGVDLILPQSLLDSLPADAKLVVPANTGGTTCRPEIRWWRLDNLLADEDDNPISGWLAEQDMITTRHSPWEWEGYDFIEDSERQAGALAYHLEAMHRLNDRERASYQGVIDQSDKGPVRSRLYDIIDTNRNGKMTSEEIRAALEKPWHAQSISQLVTRHESEWFWDASRWDELDDLMGHSPDDPNQDWVEEKNRIKTLSWWSDVAGSLKLDAAGKTWHLQPIGLLATFSSQRTEEITVSFLEKILKKPGDWFTGRGGPRSFVARFQENYPAIYKIDKEEFVKILNAALARHGITSSYQKAHFLAQCYHESAHFETTIEFASGDRYNPGQHPDAIRRGNTEMGDGPKYKGKGLIQLTWKNNYAAYSRYRGINFIDSPDLIASDMNNAIDASCWFWRNIGGVYKKYNAKGDINALIEHEKNNVDLVTLAVNGGYNGLAERKEIFVAIKKEWNLT
ncbi:Predicted chitinase [Geopseudomonas sagittaria]|uniref:Predicted chitinase n=1 Tax=Geopseudomonas sagittaria TaxID=1135990 RepID=A0A1I5NKC8_9GAMM|nr:glycoside hydrolase family 19 protein [Pseudomonas sagittaria]SFP21671.1 Predicted chitinase [Pseudomonas sagittaria]